MNDVPSPIPRRLLMVAAYVLVMVAIMADAAYGAPTVLKIATVAPNGSALHKSLQDLGSQWRNAPAGGVAIDIYPGTQGGEPQIVRRMRVGQLQGAMLSAVGLSQIEPETTALQLIPALFRDWEEVDFVREKLRPRLEKALLAKGYVVLFWGDAGWVRFFSTSPVHGPADLKPMRVFASSGNPESIELLKSLYTPVLLEPDQIVLALESGMIDAVPMPPFLANFLQVAPRAHYMLDMKWVPIVGGLVVTRRAWDGLDAATQAHLRATAEKAGVRIRAQSRREDEDAIRAMQTHQKLQVIPLSPENERAWRAEQKQAYPRIRGSLVPAEIFDEVMRALEERRS